MYSITMQKIYRCMLYVIALNSVNVHTLPVLLLVSVTFVVRMIFLKAKLNAKL